MPTKPAPQMDDVGVGPEPSRDPDDGSSGAGSEPPTDPSLLEADNVRLRVRLAAAEAEVQRRDDQLYHAVQTSQLFSPTIRMLRRRIAELGGEIDTLQTEPWDPREQGTWRDQEGDDEDWTENQ